eukprot:5555946-Pleurochrysis_carterae.AAC.2
MRRTFAPPDCCSTRFMKPSFGSAIGDAGAMQARGESSVSSSTGPNTALGSAFDDCRQSALPEASRVKGISPPPCAKSALSVESVIGG